MRFVRPTTGPPHELLRRYDHRDAIPLASRLGYPAAKSSMTESPDLARASESCCVCGLPIAAHMLAWCNACARPYHLNQRSDMPGSDCGEVWINEDHLGLEFACHTCLHPEPDVAGGLDDILDVAEAALVVGVAEDAIIAAAHGGLVRHRRTASGTYLFERVDLLDFRRGQQ